MFGFMTHLLDIFRIFYVKIKVSDNTSIVSDNTPTNAYGIHQLV